MEMSPDHKTSLRWDSGPLFLEYEEWRGVSLLKLPPWTRALVLFAACRAEHEREFSPFIERLASSQRFSLAILVDWWEAKYDYAIYTDEVKQQIKETMGADMDSFPPCLAEVLRFCLEPLAARRNGMRNGRNGVRNPRRQDEIWSEIEMLLADWDPDVPEVHSLEKSHWETAGWQLHTRLTSKLTKKDKALYASGKYHNDHLNLFGEEFMNYGLGVEEYITTAETPITAADLSVSRQNAGIKAACQRVAWSTFHFPDYPGGRSPEMSVYKGCQQAIPALVDPCPVSQSAFHSQLEFPVSAICSRTAFVLLSPLYGFLLYCTRFLFRLLINSCCSGSPGLVFMKHPTTFGILRGRRRSLPSTCQCSPSTQLSVTPGAGGDCRDLTPKSGFKTGSDAAFPGKSPATLASTSRAFPATSYSNIDARNLG